MSCNTNRIQNNNRVRVTGTFTNALDNYNPIDPSQVFFDVRQPDGTETTYQYLVDANVFRSGVGVYYMEQDITMEGNWYFRPYGTGSVVASTEVTLTVLGTQT